MKQTSLIIAIPFLFCGASCQRQAVKEAETSIKIPVKTEKNWLSAANFSKKIKNTANAQVVDVLTPKEFSKEHISNAKNIDWNGDNFQKDIQIIDTSQPVFVYCLSGGKSSAAAEAMRNSGYSKVYEQDGGMMKWRAANLSEISEKTAEKHSEISLDDFKKMTASDKPVLVDFYADWCAPCIKMKPYLYEI